MYTLAIDWFLFIRYLSYNPNRLYTLAIDWFLFIYYLFYNPNRLYTLAIDWFLFIHYLFYNPKTVCTLWQLTDSYSYVIYFITPIDCMYTLAIDWFLFIGYLFYNPYRLYTLAIDWFLFVRYLFYNAKTVCTVCQFTDSYWYVIYFITPIDWCTLRQLTDSYSYIIYFITPIDCMYTLAIDWFLFVCYLFYYPQGPKSSLRRGCPRAGLPMPGVAGRKSAESCVKPSNCDAQRGNSIGSYAEWSLGRTRLSGGRRDNIRDSSTRRSTRNGRGCANETRELSRKPQSGKYANCHIAPTWWRRPGRDRLRREIP